MTLLAGTGATGVMPRPSGTRDRRNDLEMDCMKDRDGVSVLAIPAKVISFPCFYIEKGTVRLDTGLAPDVFFGMFEKIRSRGENAV